MQEYIKKNLGTGNYSTTLIISNYEIENTIKIVKCLENSGLLIKWVSETIQNEAKEWKGGFLITLSGTWGGSLSAYMMAGRGIIEQGMVLEIFNLIIFDLTKEKE